VALTAASRAPPGGAPGPPTALRDWTSRAPGEALAVIGPSGAGKTSLLHVMGAVLLPPPQGTLLLDGQAPGRADAARCAPARQLFLAPQVPPLPPRQRVVTAVLAARLPRWGLAHSLRSLFYPATCRRRAWSALERFDLADKLWERVDRLSGGERQRVGPGACAAVAGDACG
jgi:phosphonate transport system ATP-binding protein